MRKTRVPALILAAVLGTVALTACEDPNMDTQSYEQVQAKAQARTPYLPTNDVEYNNYNRAQQLYDSPESIIWCTTSWGNPSSPLVTVPIVGKLTSSSTSYFPNTQKLEAYELMAEARSVDGMFHGNPPGYRYGFTPGGQYVDFFGMEVFCTTALTEFQRQSTTVSITTDTTANDLQKQAEDALKAGDPAAAQTILEGVTQ